MPRTHARLLVVLMPRPGGVCSVRAWGLNQYLQHCSSFGPASHAARMPNLPDLSVGAGAGPWLAPVSGGHQPGPPWPTLLFHLLVLVECRGVWGSRRGTGLTVSRYMPRST